eukprot:gene11474-15368_t
MRNFEFAEEDREPLLDMSKSDNPDPFYSVRDNVNSQIEKIKIKHEKFQDLLRNTDTSTNLEFKDLRKNIVKDLRSVDKDLTGLKGAVDMIEKNRSKFPHIKDNELNSRKRFVEDSQNSIQTIKSSMDSNIVRRKIEEDANGPGNSSYGKSNDPNSSAGLRRAENSNFIRDQKLQTQQLIEQQDNNVELLGKSVDKLGQIAIEINTEVKEQNVLLDHLEGDIEKASDKMNTVQGALEKLLKTKDGCQIWTVVILAGILILLVALVIWT